MKRILLVALSIAVAGTLVTAQALEDTTVPDCDHCETVDDECSCDGTVGGCTEDCSTCDSCECECEGCTDCEEECTCDAACDDCSCDDCSYEEEEEEIYHCGGCH